MRRLNEILKSISFRAEGSLDVGVTGVEYDSRKIRKGNVFVCLDGTRTKGSNFVKDAVEKGASAVVSGSRPPGLSGGVTFVAVDDTVSALAGLSAAYYRHPSRRMTLIGVTGTNGKTTVTYLVESIFRTAGIPVSVIGTVNYRIGNRVMPAGNTTPQSSDLQKLFAMSLNKGIKTAVIEVSSHALALGRVQLCDFDMAIFTNLTRDHLDFHGSMDDYFSAKLKLFRMLKVDPSGRREKYAIINRDDPCGSEIARQTSVPVVSYGFNRKYRVSANNTKMNHKSMSFRIYTKEGSIDIKTVLAGKHNIYNIMAACSCAMSYGIKINKIKKGIERVKVIPGRLERVDCGQGFAVFVDYAHTDDALASVLKTVRELEPKRVITVFGCGGDRDRSKRPLMGESAVKLSDYVFVTNDNPRTEDPEKIVLDIEVGIRKTGKDNYKVVLDRQEAISSAVNMADKGDVILIAGKGHENYQVLGEKHVSFDDREVARRHIRQRLAGQNTNGRK